jgi:branched-chain amino acid transport system permease protein
MVASVPVWSGSAQMHAWVDFLTLLALAQMWNLLAGYAGLVSIGQQAYIGIGAYALLALTDQLGVHPLIALPLAGLVALTISIPTALLVFRLRLEFFAIGTWVVAEVFRIGVANTNVWGGGSGATLRRISALPRDQRELETFAAAAVVGLGAVALVYVLLRSPIGLALMAMRDSETASESLGVDVFRSKLAVYPLAAFGTGLIGAVIYLNLLRIQPDAAFGINWSAFMIFMVVIGGIGTIEGPILGAAMFFVLRQTLASFGAWYLIVLGLLAIVVMVRAPNGLYGLAAARFDFSVFPIHRRLRTGRGVE